MLIRGSWIGNERLGAVLLALIAGSVWGQTGSNGVDSAFVAEVERRLEGYAYDNDVFTRRFRESRILESDERDMEACLAEVIKRRSSDPSIVLAAINVIASRGRGPNTALDDAILGFLETVRPYVPTERGAEYGRAFGAALRQVRARDLGSRMTGKRAWLHFPSEGIQATMILHLMEEGSDEAARLLEEYFNGSEEDVKVNKGWLKGGGLRMGMSLSEIRAQMEKERKKREKAPASVSKPAEGSAERSQRLSAARMASEVPESQAERDWKGGAEWQKAAASNARVRALWLWVVGGIVLAAVIGGVLLKLPRG